MISLILPYWDRQQAANMALAKIAQLYADLNMEVVVVDDGNKVPFVTPDLPLNIRVLTLPLKDEPKSPVTAWNEGVKFAKGETVVLSCIEMLHDEPILQELVDTLKDRKDYALAAAWCIEDNSWHCHSTKPVPTCPDNVGLSFCSAINRDFYLEVGGFDEDYRDGAGYEDRDFIWKLTRAGAKFIMRDDLVILHPKTGSTIHWKPEAFKRNEELYFSKCPEATPVTVVCLKAGDAFSADYVNILRDMVLRNAANKIRFVCITDDASGLDEGIDIVELPEDLEMWYGKLYMFKRGLFKDGARMVYMDLDTVITGRIDDILKYDGQFATLRDFYQADRLGPAIIAWKAGEFSGTVWDEWVNQGKPRNEMGDLWWLNNLDQGRFAHEIDILQDLYPGKFVSFKADCQVAPPVNASVVCFHGLPRPHQVKGWVENFWKIGGYSSADFEVVCNTELSKVVDNIKHSSSLDIPWLELKPETGRKILLCGGGPSLEDSLTEIKQAQAEGALIVGMNGSAQWLKSHGVLPDWMVMIDSRESNKDFIMWLPSDEYFIASQCSKKIFEHLENEKVTLFHIDIPNIGEYVADNDKPIQAIGGGSSVGLMAMSLVYTQGYRDMHLYGYDSSFRNDEGHAYAQDQQDEVIEAVVAGKTFQTTPWMVTQATQFQPLVNQLRSLGCNVSVHGGGLLPHLAWAMMVQQ